MTDVAVKDKEEDDDDDELALMTEQLDQIHASFYSSSPGESDVRTLIRAAREAEMHVNE